MGFDWQPRTGALFGIDNGRDNLGDDIPDDEVNRIEAGKHNGWPFVHGRDVRDPTLYAAMPQGLVPVSQFHGLGAHGGAALDPFLRNQPDTALNGTALVAEHGSWNRTEKSGSGCEEDEEVICRPVDVLEAPDCR